MRLPGHARAARLLGLREKKLGEVGKGLGRGEGLVGPHGQLATKPGPADFFFLFFSFFFLIFQSLFKSKFESK